MRLSFVPRQRCRTHCFFHRYGVCSEIRSCRISSATVNPTSGPLQHRHRKALPLLSSGSRFCRNPYCVSEIGGPISSISGVHCVGCFDGQMCGIKPHERSY
jgi:hypothetical protein